MGIEDLGLLLENIEEYVMEQKKIVTYKWLSRTFSINVNQAKQLLAIFHMKHKNMKHKSIQGIYYVSGMRENSEGQLTHQICIVTEDLLEATKAQLNPLTSVHLYSVQKGKPKDTASVYNVDFEQLKKKVYETTEFSMIKCPKAKISQVINSSLRPVTPPALKNKVKVMSHVKSSSTDTSSSKQQSKKASSTKSENKKADLSNFFSKGKAETKSSNLPETTKSPVKSRVTSGEKKLKTFESTKQKENKLVKQKTYEKKKVEKDVKPLQVDDKVVENDVEHDKVSRSNGKSSGGAGGKRKRIQKMSSSSGSEGENEMDQKNKSRGIDENEDNLNEQLKETSIRDNDNQTVRQSPRKNKPQRKRVRKLVSKTSVNDEGFMETEKVWQEFSCSEEETEKKKETEVKPSAKPSARPGNKNKQSSLMGYFKKT